MKTKITVLSCLIILMSTLTVPVVGGRQPTRQPEGDARGHVGDNVEAYRDLEYARVGDSSLLLDVFVPRKAESPPLLVWIHGGAWRGGSKG